MEKRKAERRGEMRDGIDKEDTYGRDKAAGETEKGGSERERRGKGEGIEREGEDKEGREL